MRIGIISLVPNDNYGGILQSYALKTVLEEQGHSVQVISKSQYLKVFSIGTVIRFPVRLVRHILSRRHEPISPEANYNEKRKFTNAELEHFIECHLNIRYIKSFHDIMPDEFDMLVVGSDQVWRPMYFESQYNESIRNAFLSFARKWDVKRIAYAASFGTDVWEYNENETLKCGSLLKAFDGISVRESSGKVFCNEKFAVRAEVLCDPTFLVTTATYRSLCGYKKSKKSGGVMVYCLDSSDYLRNIVDAITKKLNSDAHYFWGSSSSRKDNGIDRIPSVESWLNAIMDSDFVITDSFHACVFSLLFHKPFAVILNENRGGTRIKSLLFDYKQENRIIYSTDMLSMAIFSQPNCDDVIECNRMEGLNYINRYLV